MRSFFKLLIALYTIHTWLEILHFICFNNDPIFSTYNKNAGERKSEFPSSILFFNLSSSYYNNSCSNTWKWVPVKSDGQSFPLKRKIVGCTLLFQLLWSMYCYWENRGNNKINVTPKHCWNLSPEQHQWASRQSLHEGRPRTAMKDQLVSDHSLLKTTGKPR